MSGQKQPQGDGGATSGMHWSECPFRHVEAIQDGEGTAPPGARIICQAGGDEVLGFLRKREQADSVCEACDIPKTLTLGYACLYLLPFRVFREKEVRSYFACRWFINIPPENLHRDIVWCRACRDWFPRPPESLIPGQIAWSRKARELFLDPTRATRKRRSPERQAQPEPGHDRWLTRLLRLTGRNVR